MKKKTIRAVIYVRFSSHRQNDSFTIEYQMQEATRYIEANGYTLVDSYVDAATTGKKTAGRESFNKMIKDAENGKFDKIVVFSFSRSFRNTRDALNYNYDLMEKYNVTIESVIEPIDFTNPHGKFSGTNLFAMHELQSDIIAGHVKAGMYIAAQKGYYLGGFVPFGYELYNTGEFTRGKPRKKYKPNKKESAIVKKIFDMYANGFTLNYIQKVVRDMGAIGRRGDVLSKQTIAQMLKKPFYIGTRDYKIAGYEPLYIANAVPAIIDAETWAKVQTRHGSNKPTAPRRTKRLYALTGKLICKECGGNLTGTARPSKKYSYEYYRCTNKEGKNNCSMKNVRKDLIEEYAIKQIKKHILNETAIKQISHDILKRVENLPDDIEEKIKKASNRREKINGIIKKIRKDMYENEITKEAGDEMIKEYSDELNALEIELNEMQSVVNSAVTADKIEAYLNELLLMTESKNDEIIKNLFDKLIDKIDVYADRIELFLNVAPFGRNELCGQPFKPLRLNVERAKISGVNNPASK